MLQLSDLCQNKQQGSSGWARTYFLHVGQAAFVQASILGVEFLPSSSEEEDIVSLGMQGRTH